MYILYEYCMCTYIYISPQGLAHRLMIRCYQSYSQFSAKSEDS